MSLNGVNGFNPMEKPNFTNTTPLKGDEVDVTKKSLLPSEPKKPESQGPIEHTDDVPKGRTGDGKIAKAAHEARCKEVADIKEEASRFEKTVDIMASAVPASVIGYVSNANNVDTPAVNYYFDVPGCGSAQYMAAVYPDFNSLSVADRQKVIEAFKEANPGVWGGDYSPQNQYDKPDGSGKFEQKGLPVHFPDVDLGDGRILTPDLSKKPI